MTHDPETAERLQMFLPPLLTALQEARNAALREAADLCVEYSTHHGTGMFDKHSHACSEAILTLIDTPAPPADPAGDALRELREAAADVLAQVAFVPVKHPGHTHQRDRLRAALAAAPAPQPTPQPDADERKAMVDVILDAMLGRYPGRDMARAVADALLAAGWARKREGE